MKESKIISEFEFLISDYGFIYKKHVFSSYYGFLGPMILYTFHNRYGCFTIFHAFQRNEIDYYYSDLYSESVKELTKNSIDFKEIWKNRYSHKFDRLLFQLDELKLLRKYIQRQIDGEGEFFGIKCMKNIK